jgi:signal transduction histidine kinase
MASSLKQHGGSSVDVDKILAALSQSAEDGQHIAKCVGYIQSILNNTLDMNKLKEGRLNFQLKNVNIRTEIIDSALMMLSAMKSEGVEVLVECGVDVFACTDALRLTQAFLNLMTNAFKFCKQGSILIRAIYLRESHTVEIAIEDTGPGVPLEHRHKLFTKYGQIAVRQGTGLGLVLSRV